MFETEIVDLVTYHKFTGIWALILHLIAICIGWIVSGGVVDARFDNRKILLASCTYFLFVTGYMYAVPGNLYSATLPTLLVCAALIPSYVVRVSPGRRVFLEEVKLRNNFSAVLLALVVIYVIGMEFFTPLSYKESIPSMIAVVMLLIGIVTSRLGQRLLVEWHRLIVVDKVTPPE